MKSEINIIVNYRLLIKAMAFVFACSFVFSANAQSAQEFYKNANQFYKSKQYQQAADIYEKIIGQGYKSAEVYYNLGNCYYKLSSIGKSILSFERALKLSPKDEDIIHNLKLAELKCLDKIQPVPQLDLITWWNNFISSNDSKGWGIFSLVAIWLSILVFVISFFIGRNRISNLFSILFLLLSFIFLTLAINQKHNEQNSDSAILMVSNTNVKSAPDGNANDLFILHEGIKLQLLDKVGEWNKIHLADGKVGWIEKGSFEKI